MRNLEAIAVLLAFCACASGANAAADQVPAEARARIKTITVISAIGDEIHFLKTGEITHVEFDYPIADWRLNRAIVAEVQRVIGAKYAIKAMNAPLAFRQPVYPSRFADAMSQRVQLLPPDPQTDAYLIVAETYGDDNIFVQGIMHGPHVLKISAIFAGVTQEYTEYAVALVDARSFETIAMRTRDKLPPDRSFKPSQNIWANGLDEFSEEQRNTIKSEFTQLITGTLDATLVNLRLAE